MTKWVYSFGAGTADGSADMKNLLGGKGANLAEMSSLGLPVPAGFTITTEVCTAYYDNDRRYPDELSGQLDEALAKIEAQVGVKFGDAKDPLLVSVRSGARASMPGMMDTVLNLGLNDETVRGLATASGDERFAYDSYRRFIQMFGDVVLEVDHHHFEEILELHKEDRGYSMDTDLNAEDWRKVIEGFKAKIVEETGEPFPQNPKDQLWAAVSAVFGSWMNQRAITYRRLHAIPASWGTAVNVQAMVFGNMGDDCATGVAFTRDPSTGENIFYGEYLVNAQGEDVVAGIRTPQHLTIQGKVANGSDLPAMEEVMPEVFGQLNDVRLRLEKHYRDIQDVEFTVQRGTLYMLQTRAGKRTAPAALKIAVDFVNEGLITKEEAISRVDPASLDQLLHPTLDPDAPRHVLTRGLPASPGAASGKIVFSADAAEKQAAAGDTVILCRIETSPDDIHGMHAAKGILTTRGGMTSHAAVVARGMGRACVAGAGELRIDYKTGVLRTRTDELREGDLITIDGGSGEVMKGEVPTLQPELSGDFGILMGWADSIRQMEVRANADTPTDCRTARDFGAEGVGLCRTEHMFFEGERIVAVREMIMADNERERRAALAKILPMQRQDFIEIFEIMDGLPVTIRLLDPPLHEFLPHGEAELAEFAEASNMPLDIVRSRAGKLNENNPMLGHRGCRLGISYPEIYEMQVRAIFEAAAHVSKELDKSVEPEVMIPLIAVKREIEILKELVDRVAQEVMDAEKTEIKYLVGTMIELPRAALRASEIAEEAEFFSFGTNDLTQTTYGLSRDDAGSFLGTYEHRGIIEQDPFISLDDEGVGELVSIATERGQAQRPDIKLGICGEHGGDPSSIHFCQKVGLDYVSCSPYRVPIARLAAAQAALTAKRQ
ncbi:pyruvate, phosphate dikinase [Denitrobaculum tricleocarpae]|uniref:Pyruvate, phosphate dikinase n=1 Tax=Denitrobaculum tricleocarpae TaxID=2591009 RepID=A0A545TXG6_9PROT|nr:pyruvate, phosphate dikinase [Denitrobaculum tricleocarpae]TQV81890.1 pyruvate, phosphate dikinase [Denitrobaculum tricleocarpae]